MLPCLRPGGKDIGNPFGLNWLLCPAVQPHVLKNVRKYLIARLTTGDAGMLYRHAHWLGQVAGLG